MVKVNKLIERHLGDILKPYLAKNERVPPLDRHISNYFK